MILTHFSKFPLELDLKKEYRFRDNQPFHKPRGLWLSDETTEMGWKDWCEGESWRVDHLQHQTDFHCDLSRWLVIDTEEKLLKFARARGIVPPWSFEIGIKLRHIDWSEIEKEYAGIVISPYQWNCRLDYLETHWYYGWDCASACVWDLSTIKIAEKVA